MRVPSLCPNCCCVKWTSTASFVGRCPNLLATLRCGQNATRWTRGMQLIGAPTLAPARRSRYRSVAWRAVSPGAVLSARESLTVLRFNPPYCCVIDVFRRDGVVLGFAQRYVFVSRYRPSIVWLHTNGLVTDPALAVAIWQGIQQRVSYNSSRLARTPHACVTKQQARCSSALAERSRSSYSSRGARQNPSHSGAGEWACGGPRWQVLTTTRF